MGELYGCTCSASIHQNAPLPCTEREQQWQRVRRGRYAKFNPALDRGTRFDLETGGRPKSILRSLPRRPTGTPTSRPPCPKPPRSSGSGQGIDWLAVGADGAAA